MNSELTIKAKDAEKRIGGHIRETPLEMSYSLSQMGECHVYLKMENWQITGSFKLRGAANMILSLSEAEKEKGVTATSSGNQGVAALSIASFIKAHKNMIIKM